MNNTDVVRTSLIFWQCRRSLVLCVCFVDRCLSFSTFSFGQCVVCSSSTYRFWLPLWYLQTLFILRTKIITFARQINRERNNNFFRNKNNAGQANTPVLISHYFFWEQCRTDLSCAHKSLGDVKTLWQCHCGRIWCFSNTLFKCLLWNNILYGLKGSNR